MQGVWERHQVRLSAHYNFTANDGDCDYDFDYEHDCDYDYDYEHDCDYAAAHKTSEVQQIAWKEATEMPEEKLDLPRIRKEFQAIYVEFPEERVPIKFSPNHFYHFKKSDQ